jgi:type IV pilus assembly protein PilV
MMTPSHRRSLSCRARGFTLLEALVALLVLSIGLLGVAALQLSSLKSNSSAAQRSQATFLAYDILDRMRANRDAALSGQYVIAYGAAAPATPTTIAQRDLVEWKTRIANTLTADSADVDGDGVTTADGAIQFDAATQIVTIRIHWNDLRGTITEDERDELDDGALLEFRMQSRI